MINKDEEMEDFMDFILTNNDEDKEKELGLSHPSPEFEAKEREAADQIELEKEIDRQTPYYTCNRFQGDSKGICEKIHSLGPWLKDKDGLNM